MKVIIAGGRDFDDWNRVQGALTNLGSGHPAEYIFEIVSGGAKGADADGEFTAEHLGISVKKFPADWEKYGKAAGHIRNAEMAKYADTLVAFWDGKSRGTKGMIGLALKEGLEVHVYRYKLDEGGADGTRINSNNSVTSLDVDSTV